MIEKFEMKHKEQFGVFESDEFGNFKPVFLIAKCQPHPSFNKPIYHPKADEIQEVEEE